MLEIKTLKNCLQLIVGVLGTIFEGLAVGG